MRDFLSGQRGLKCIRAQVIFAIIVFYLSWPTNLFWDFGRGLRNEPVFVIQQFKECFLIFSFNHFLDFNWILLFATRTRIFSGGRLYRTNSKIAAQLLQFSGKTLIKTFRKSKTFEVTQVNQQIFASISLSLSLWIGDLSSFLKDHF